MGTRTDKWLILLLSVDLIFLPGRVEARGNIMSVKAMQMAVVAVYNLNQAMSYAAELPQDQPRRVAVQNAYRFMVLSVANLGKAAKRNEIVDADLPKVLATLGGAASKGFPTQYKSFLNNPSKGGVPSLGAGFPTSFAKANLNLIPAQYAGGTSGGSSGGSGKLVAGQPGQAQAPRSDIEAQLANLEVTKPASSNLPKISVGSVSVGSASNDSRVSVGDITDKNEVTVNTVKSKNKVRVGTTKANQKVTVGKVTVPGKVSVGTISSASKVSVGTVTVPNENRGVSGAPEVTVPEVKLPPGAKEGTWLLLKWLPIAQVLPLNDRIALAESSGGGGGGVEQGGGSEESGSKAGDFLMMLAMVLATAIQAAAQVKISENEKQAAFHKDDTTLKIEQGKKDVALDTNQKTLDGQKYTTDATTAISNSQQETTRTNKDKELQVLKDTAAQTAQANKDQLEYQKQLDEKKAKIVEDQNRILEQANIRKSNLDATAISLSQVAASDSRSLLVARPTPSPSVTPSPAATVVPSPTVSTTGLSSALGIQETRATLGLSANNRVLSSIQVAPTRGAGAVNRRTSGNAEDELLTAAASGQSTDPRNARFRATLRGMGGRGIASASILGSTRANPNPIVAQTSFTVPAPVPTPAVVVPPSSQGQASGAGVHGVR